MNGSSLAPVTESASLTPAELLELSGQFEPPIRLWPILEQLGVPYEHRDLLWARTDGETLILPSLIRARQPGVNLAIAHDLRQHLLGIPGRADDGAYPYLREQEQQFDRWARELVLPASTFRRDALGRRPVLELAGRYNVRPFDVVDRGQDLELTDLICRDRQSYAIYLKHAWWAGSKGPNPSPGRRVLYFTTHQICEVVGCPAYARFCHHVSYARLGRELDEDLRALCPVHHNQELHGRSAQLPLFE